MLLLPCFFESAICGWRGQSPRNSDILRTRQEEAHPTSQTLFDLRRARHYSGDSLSSIAPGTICLLSFLLHPRQRATRPAGPIARPAKLCVSSRTSIILDSDPLLSPARKHTRIRLLTNPYRVIATGHSHHDRDQAADAEPAPVRRWRTSEQ